MSKYVEINTCLNNQWFKEEIMMEIMEHIEMRENKNTKCQNFWDTAKTVLRGKFTAKYVHA